MLSEIIAEEDRKGLKSNNLGKYGCFFVTEKNSTPNGYCSQMVML